MKFPIPPRRPLKPTDVPEHLIKNNSLGFLRDLKYMDYSILEFTEIIKEKFPNEKIEDIRFSFEIEEERDYYSESIKTIRLDVYKEEIYNNPYYQAGHAKYLQKLKIYEAEKEDYEKALVKYETDYKKYQEEQLEIQLEKARKFIADYESKSK